mmetsp:Transcript_17302/g.47638  ORF Transcript_17302/g.47638 Transcript_17302/m.47638 type:complete len:294 (-) Transcript_17302:292-1173(-)
MIGDFRCEKEHVLHEIANRLQALSKASFLLPTQKELVIKAGIVPVFRYSAGLVPWSLPELENITALWVRAYRIAWRMPDGTDSGLFRLPPRGGGRGCPSATQIWLADALQLLDHCDRIPGEVRTVVRQATLDECKAHGCLDLFQLQRAMRLCPLLARTVLELLVCRLDEHGLDAVPAHRPPQLGTLIIEALWSRLWARNGRTALTATGDPNPGSCLLASRESAGFLQHTVCSPTACLPRRLAPTVCAGLQRPVPWNLPNSHQLVIQFRVVHPLERCISAALSAELVDGGWVHC